MAYATVDDMIAQWGEAEMVRLSSPEGQLDDLVVVARVELALTDASAVIDSYLRRRYPVPLDAPPPTEVARACRTLARYELARGEQKTAGSDLRADRDEIMAWLKAVAEGRLDLPVALPASTAAGGLGARFTDRPRDIGPGDALRW
jgi:phage gp36-like protein